jgi:DNA-binding transcriptional ArsR family regulator
MDATSRGSEDSASSGGVSTRAEVLARVSDGDAKFDQLQSGLDLAPTELSEAITWLKDNGLVETKADADPKDPVYTLTDDAVKALNDPQGS